jgi:hypothetical protein
VSSLWGREDCSAFRQLGVEVAQNWVVLLQDVVGVGRALVVVGVVALVEVLDDLFHWHLWW